MSDSPSKTTISQDLGFLFLRLILGAVMIFHGAQKEPWKLDGEGMQNMVKTVENKIPIPEFIPPIVAAQAAGWSEYAGGILLIAGLFTRLSAFFIAATMGVASFIIHAEKFSLKEGGMEFSLTLCVIAVALVFIGPGRISFDKLFFGRSKKPSSESK